MKMKVKLKDLGTISTGNTPSKNVSEFYDSEDIGFVKPDIISDSQIDFVAKTTEYLSEAARTKARIVKKNAVFVTCIGSIGKVGIAKDNEFAFNQQINAIEPNEKVIPKYLAYGIFANKKKLQAIANAPVVPIINKTQFGEFEIDIADDIEEQVKIVELLDKVGSIIADRKIELEKLDELIKARFVELFGDPVVNPKSWETALLSNLIIKANNGMARRGKDEEGSIVLRLVELQNGFIDYSAPNRICLNETEKKRYELVDNDFLFARVNGNPDYVGRCAVFKSIDEPVFHNDHIIRVHFNEAKINGCYMSVLLNSDYGKRQRMVVFGKYQIAKMV